MQSIDEKGSINQLDGVLKSIEAWKVQHKTTDSLAYPVAEALEKQVTFTQQMLRVQEYIKTVKSRIPVKDRPALNRYEFALNRYLEENLTSTLDLSSSSGILSKTPEEALNQLMTDYQTENFYNQFAYLGEMTSMSTEVSRILQSDLKPTFFDRFTRKEPKIIPLDVLEVMSFFVSAPFQRIMRYEMPISEAKKVLDQRGEANSSLQTVLRTLKNIAQAIDPSSNMGIDDRLAQAKLNGVFQLDGVLNSIEAWKVQHKTTDSLAYPVAEALEKQVTFTQQMLRVQEYIKTVKSSIPVTDRPALDRYEFALNRYLEENLTSTLDLSSSSGILSKTPEEALNQLMTDYQKEDFYNQFAYLGEMASVSTEVSRILQSDHNGQISQDLSDVRNFVSAPFQRIMRYEMPISEAKKMLDRRGEANSLLQTVLTTLKNIAQAIQPSSRMGIDDRLTQVKRAIAGKTLKRSKGGKISVPSEDAVENDIPPINNIANHPSTTSTAVSKESAKDNGVKRRYDDENPFSKPKPPGRVAGGWKARFQDVQQPSALEPEKDTTESTPKKSS